MKTSDTQPERRHPVLECSVDAACIIRSSDRVMFRVIFKQRGNSDYRRKNGPLIENGRFRLNITFVSHYQLHYYLIMKFDRFKINNLNGNDYVTRNK